jgi:ankyrin repeat protein
LHHACARGHTDLALMLVAELNASPERIAKNGRTPLNEAYEWGHYSTVCALVELGSEPILNPEISRTQKKTVIMASDRAWHNFFPDSG